MFHTFAYYDLQIMEYLTTLIVKFYFWKYDIRDWKLEFFNTVIIGGQVDYETKILNVSRYFLRNCKILSMKTKPDLVFSNSKNQVSNWILNFPILNLRNLILHEIAHILTENEEQHHGPRWRNLFRKMGGDGETCVECFITKSDYLWVQSCTNCDEDDNYCFRRTRVHCQTCGSYLHSRPNPFNKKKLC